MTITDALIFIVSFIVGYVGCSLIFLWLINRKG